MSSLQPVTFSGTFYNLNTYSLAFDAVEREGGVSVESLEMLRMKLKERYGDHIEVTGDMFKNPAVMIVDGHPDCVIQADRFIRGELDKQEVNYGYQPNNLSKCGSGGHTPTCGSRFSFVG